MANLDERVLQEAQRITRRALFRGAFVSAALPSAIRLDNTLNAFAVAPSLKDRRDTPHGTYTPDGIYIPYGIPGNLPFEPKYLYWPDMGSPGNFTAHVKDAGNEGGIDLTFGHGAPIISPLEGIVYSAEWNNNIGYTLDIDYGIFHVKLTHLKTYFDLKRGDKIKRGQIVGREGNSGNNARDSHLHLGIALPRSLTRGNTKIFDDRNYKDYGNRSRGLFSQWNTVVNPDVLTGSDEILIKNPWDYEKDNDAEYLKLIDKIREGLGIGSDPLKEVLIRYLNELYNKRAMLPQATLSYIKEAVNLIRFTSPYIDHKNPEVILKAMNANPRYKALISAYYERFLPKGEALDELLVKMNLPKDFLDYKKTPSGLLVPPQYAEANGTLTRRELIRL